MAHSSEAPAEARPQVRALIPDDWAPQAASTVERVVTQVRERTTAPALTAARAVVYGLLAAILGTAALILVTIGVVRLLTEALGERAWAAHGILGLLFLVAGALCWRRARSRPR